MVLGCGLLTVNDAAMKSVVADHSVSQAVFVRGLFALVPIFLLVRHAGGWPALRWTNVGGQMAAAALLVVALFLFINALALLPLTIAIIVIYSNPLFVTALAPWALGERVGWRRWSAVVVGFAGVLLVVGPEVAAFSWALLLPLTVALLTAARDLLVRRVIAGETSVSLLAFSSLAVTFCALPGAVLDWAPLEMFEIVVLAVAALFFALGLFLMTEALRFADASLVSPYKYSGVIWAALLGFLLWRETPSLEVWLGAALIVISGLFILGREKTLSSGPARSEAPATRSEGPLEP